MVPVELINTAGGGTVFVFDQQQQTRSVFIATDLGHLVVEQGSAEGFGDPQHVVWVYHMHKLDAQQILGRCRSATRGETERGGDGQVIKNELPHEARSHRLAAG